MRSCTPKQLKEVTTVPSLWWVLLDRTLQKVPLKLHREMFDRVKTFCMHVRAKGVTYTALPDYFGMSDAAQRSQWLTPSGIVQGCEEGNMCNAASSPTAEYVWLRGKKMYGISAWYRLLVVKEHILLAISRY